MSVRTVLALTGAVLIGGLVLAVPAAAEPAVQPVAASVRTLSTGRVGASSAALVGLLGAAVGGLASARPTGRGRLRPWARRNGPVTALVAGPIAVVVGTAVAVTADGGLGTGNGLGGAYVAVLVGLASVALGWRARSRARRTG
ncbi:hypothetical protein GCM10010275_50950 [Streptomyces litmocidini]|uniref:DUF6223 family protein n=1 Tax=Streptomyces litmocidini TaxID=67318 RepID=UPI00167F024E|nr:DUF6223 family protein [Streptomyces litmocidini]GGV05247.1 hypothetical protein GCM10010275_50950 [Streptomyces litmocidini]